VKAAAKAMTSSKLRTSVEFDAAHFLPNYEGKCKNMHGHRWLVKIEIGTNAKRPNGMIVDFTVIKNHINENYDHRILNKCPFPPITIQNLQSGESVDLAATPFKWGPFDNPTAENIAEKLATDIFGLLPKAEGYDIGWNGGWNREYVQVELFESPKSSVVAIVHGGRDRWSDGAKPHDGDK